MIRRRATLAEEKKKEDKEKKDKSKGKTPSQASATTGKGVARRATLTKSKTGASLKGDASEKKSQKSDNAGGGQSSS